MENNEKPNALLSEALQWLSSPRGGDNFYGRVLNGGGRKAAECNNRCEIRGR